MKETMETAETGNAGVTRNQGADAAHPVVVRVPTDDDMRELGRRVALLLHGGDVLLLSARWAQARRRSRRASAPDWT